MVASSSVLVRLEDLDGFVDTTTFPEVPQVGDHLRHGGVIHEVVRRIWTPQQRRDHEAIVVIAVPSAKVPAKKSPPRKATS